MEAAAFQDRIPHNYCWGCGPLNEHGLHIKSYWAGERSVCTWQPAARYAAGPRHILNGGVIATVIDCHCICTAIADGYRLEGRSPDTEPLIWCATAQLNVRYLRPARLDRPLQMAAWITDRGSRKTLIECSLTVEGEECAHAEVIAVRVPLSWREEAERL